MCMEPLVHIFEKALSPNVAGNAIDYFCRNAEEKKKCVYVYISTRLYTHTLKINIQWSFKPGAKLEKLFFVLESFLAPQAKDSLPLAAELQQGILAAPAVVALLGGLQRGKKPCFIWLLFFIWYYLLSLPLHFSRISPLLLFKSVQQFAIKMLPCPPLILFAGCPPCLTLVPPPESCCKITLIACPESYTLPSSP